MLSSEDVKNDKTNIPMNGMFITDYVLLAISIIAVLVSATINILTSPKSIKKTLIYLGVFLGVLLISYPLSFVLFGTDKVYQWISAGITATYLLLIGSLIAVIFSVVKRT